MPTDRTPEEIALELLPCRCHFQGSSPMHEQHSECATSCHECGDCGLRVHRGATCPFCDYGHTVAAAIREERERANALEAMMSCEETPLAHDLPGDGQRCAGPETGDPPGVLLHRCALCQIGYWRGRAERAEAVARAQLEEARGYKRHAHLFRSGAFTLHSGEASRLKIDCDALSDEDLHTLAWMISERTALFTAVEGVPNGGLRLAESLLAYRKPSPPYPPVLLIVDDVLTTGASMEAQRNGRDAIGYVVFARGPLPKWVSALFTLGYASDH